MTLDVNTEIALRQALRDTAQCMRALTAILESATKLLAEELKERQNGRRP